MKTLEDERYVVIKAYKCTVSEIWRDSFVLAYNSEQNSYIGVYLAARSGVSSQIRDAPGDRQA